MHQNTKFIVIGVIVALACAAVLFTKEKNIFRFENNGVVTSLIRVKSNDSVFIKCKFNHAGVLSNSAERHGISVVIGELIFRKLNDLSAEETTLVFSRHGIHNFKVDSSRDDFEVSFCVLKPLAKDALEFLSEAFSAPKFTKNELEYVKQHFPKISDTDTTHPQILLAEKLKELLYGNHNYGKNSDGTARAISSITADDINDYMKKYFVKNNMQIIFAGDISMTDISDYTNILTKNMPEGDAVEEKTVFDPVVSDKKIEIINKTNMNDIVGVIFGVRADKPSITEQAALNILIHGLFNSKNGAFFEALNKRNITVYGKLMVQKNKYSTMYAVCVFMNKKDLQQYYDFLQKTLKEYHSALKLSNFERAKAFFMKRAETGSETLSNIDEIEKEKHLPFGTISYQIVKKVAKKLFSATPIVVIGNDIQLNQQ